MYNLSNAIALRFKTREEPQQWIVPLHNVRECFFAGMMESLIIVLFDPKTNEQLKQLIFTQQRILMNLRNGQLAYGPVARITSIDQPHDYDYLVYSCDEQLTYRETQLLAIRVSTKDQLARRVLKVHELPEATICRL